MNQLQVFNFEENKVRILSIDDEPYFVGKDVAEVLGYSNTRDALAKHVDNEDKLTSQITTAGQNRNMTIINESGLYALIFGSQLNSSRKFKRWVTSEVLPQIRQTGKYEEPKSPMEIMRLQFEALDETNKRVDTMEGDVEYLKKEVPLSTGEYNYISKQVNKAVYEAVDTFGLSNRREVTSELYKDINRGVNEIASIKTRTQLKQRHFYPVYEFINQWNPSTAVLIKVRQLTLDLSEDQEDRS